MDSERLSRDIRLTERQPGRGGVVKSAEQLAAELALLREYDRARTVRGHDYGCGQRHAEIARRQRELESLCSRSGPSAYELERDASPAELLAAFDRVGRPRVRRAQGEEYRRATPATRRTLQTWRSVARWVGVELEAVA